MTLVEFLTARIAEDEAVAHRASEDPYVRSWPGALMAPALNGDPGTRTVSTPPTRVLAECEAKRVLLTKVLEQIESDESTIASEYGTPGTDWTTTADMLLHTLAIPYADHPDYLAEWAP